VFSKVKSINKVEKVGFINRFINKEKIKQLIGRKDSKLIYYTLWSFMFKTGSYRIVKLHSRIALVSVVADESRRADILDIISVLFVNKEIEERRLISNIINSNQTIKIKHSFCKAYRERRFCLLYKTLTYNFKKIELVCPSFSAVNAISNVINQRER